MPLIASDRLTLPKMLRRHDYATGCIGKWHLGMQWARTDGKQSAPTANRVPDAVIDFSQPFTAGPLSVGFNYYFGTDASDLPPYCFLKNDRIVGPVLDRLKPKSWYGYPGHMQKGWRFDNIMPTLTKQSVRFIRDHVKQNKNKPFFLFIALTAPHTPITPSAPFVGMTQIPYGDSVCEVDAHLDAVVSAVDDAGIADETLIVFTSDNGSPARTGKNTGGPLGSVLRDSDHRPNGPWRGMKADIHEAGHRVPLIARWPGRIKPNTHCDQLFCLTDLFATCAAIVGHRLLDDSGEDSINLLPLLLGQHEGRRIRHDLVLHSLDGMFAIRQGDWKLIAGLGSGGFTKPKRVKPKPGGPAGQLYNLATDPAEQDDLYLVKPDVVSRLSALLKKYQDERRSVSR